jgi:hypothetical protein
MLFAILAASVITQKHDAGRQSIIQQPRPGSALVSTCDLSQRLGLPLNGLRQPLAEKKSKTPRNHEISASAESLEEADRRREEMDSGRVQPVAEKAFWAGIDFER